MTKKKTKSTSVSEHGKAVSGAYLDIKPPAHVRLAERDMPFFESVISECAKSEWSNHQLEIASILARTMSHMENEQFMLHEEGSVAKTDKGTPVVNPRKSVVQMYASSILSLRKSLGLDARAEGNGRDLKTKREKAKKQEAGAVKDDLIAQPTQH